MKESCLAAIFFIALLFPNVALSDWRGEIGVFRIGLVADNPAPDQIDSLEPFRTAISDALDMEVEFFRGRNPQALIDALASDRIEYVIFSSFAYALASTTCQCIEPLVTPRAIDSTDGYHLVLISRNSDLLSLSSLAGKTVAMLAAEDGAEGLLVKRAISEAGVDLNSVSFTSLQTGEDTLKAFSAGQFDALAGWSSMNGIPSEGYSRGTLRLIGQMQLGNPGDYSVFWQSALIPHMAHATAKNLPGEAKNILRNLLNNLHDRNPAAYDSIEPVYGGGFVTSRHSRYQPLLSVVEAMNVVEAAKQPEAEIENPPQE